jgi:hypothetical protein
MIVGSGKFQYRVNADWAKLPERWSFKEVGGVGVDSRDNAYVFNRGEHPMMIFDREGSFLRSWGEGQYPRAHGVHMAPDDTMFLTDDGGHFVRKVTLDGKVLLELGVPGKPAPYMSSSGRPMPEHRRRRVETRHSSRIEPGSFEPYSPFAAIAGGGSRSMRRREFVCSSGLPAARAIASGKTKINMDRHPGITP